MTLISSELTEGVKLDVINLSPHIAAEVRGLDLSRPLDVMIAKALQNIWLDRAVLVFRRQKLDQEAFVRFTRYFGQTGERTASTNTSYAKKHVIPEIMLISNVRENGEPIGALPDGELHFHHDMIQTNVPHKASMLYALDCQTMAATLVSHQGTLPMTPLTRRSKRSLKASVCLTPIDTAQQSAENSPGPSTISITLCIRLSGPTKRLVERPSTLIG